MRQRQGAQQPKQAADAASTEALSGSVRSASSASELPLSSDSEVGRTVCLLCAACKCQRMHLLGMPTHDACCADAIEWLHAASVGALDGRNVGGWPQVRPVGQSAAQEALQRQDEEASERARWQLMQVCQWLPIWLLYVLMKSSVLSNLHAVCSTLRRSSHIALHNERIDSTQPACTLQGYLFFALDAHRHPALSSG